jgi:hypothetical protein
MKKRNTCLEGHHNKSENKEMNREHVFFERKKQCQSSVILLLPFEEGTKEERETWIIAFSTGNKRHQKLILLVAFVLVGER